MNERKLLQAFGRFERWKNVWKVSSRAGWKLI